MFSWQGFGYLVFTTMKLDTLFKRITENGSPSGGKTSQTIASSVLKDASRLPNGTFQFKAQLAKGTPLILQVSSDLETWCPLLNDIGSGETTSYADGQASRFNFRFYRLLAGKAPGSNIIGYVSITLPPGFSMIANPLQGSANPLSKVFKDWPDGTTLNKFDTQLFRLVENSVKSSQWANPSESLSPGEGAIFFNPTSDYRSVCFTGEVLAKNLSISIPAGFSIRSSPVPQLGSLVEDLDFPIANGDVIHLFDREKQQYVLHPYENGLWTAGAPVVSVGESFWVAKTEPGNWTRTLDVTAGLPPSSNN
jgi:hypothetical protein